MINRIIRLIIIKIKCSLKGKALDIAGKISINKKNYGKFDPHKSLEGLFFGPKKQSEQADKNKFDYEELTGLNYLDSKVFRVNNISSDPIRLEIQIENTEKKLKKIREEININKKLEIIEFKSNEKLYKKEQKLKRDYAVYRKNYRNLGLSYKIADTINHTGSSISNGLSLFKEEIEKNVVVKKLLNINPVYREKQKVKTAHFVNKKLKNELAKPFKKSDNLENFLMKSEKVIVVKREF